MTKAVTKILALCVVMLGITGCAVDQQKERNLYRSVLDAHLPAPKPYVADAPLSLREALLLANRNNEQLAMRGEDFVQALIAKNRVAAAFLPTVSFQPNYTIEQRAREDGGTSTGPGGTGLGFNNTSSTSGGSGFRNSGQIAHRLEAPVVGSMNLFRGFGDVANLASAEAVAAERREELLDAQATILINVSQVYYQVLRSEQAVEVIRNSLRVQEARLADVTQQFKNGLAIQLTVAQTRAQVDATRVTLIQAESDVRNGRIALALLIGVNEVQGRLEEDITAPPAEARPTQAELERLALETRQDARAAAAAVAAAKQAVQVAIAQYYPSVSLNVTGFLYREFYADASKWSAILTANIPIFSAGIIEADVRNAWSRLRQAALFESYVHRQVLRDVRQAYENLKTADQRISQLQDQVKASEDAYVQAVNAFQNQLAINLDVQVALDQLLNSQLQLASAEFDRTVFWLDLVRSTGRMGDVAIAGPLSPAPFVRPLLKMPSTQSAATRPATQP
jgi:outer membrane protein TolC